MAVELKVPPAGESITEVVIVEWLKKEGAHAERDEPVALIETDKANVEVMAPTSGVLARILKPAGETVRIGDVIGLLEPGDAPRAEDVAREAAAKQEATQKAQEKVIHAPQAPRAEGPRPAPRPSEPSRPAEPGSATPTAKAIEGAKVHAENGAARGELRVPPSIRRALREADMRPEDVRPMHPEDVKKLRDKVPTPVPGAPSDTGAGDLRGARALSPRQEPATMEPASAAKPERIVPMTPLRRRVAERLVTAQQTAALLTTFNEVDMSSVMALRKQHAEAFKERHGVKLGFMSFFVKAAIEALRAFPAINAEIRGNDIVYHDYADIGVAVGGGKGLVVPVIRSAEKKSFAEIERTIADFGERAKAGRLRVDELTGGTFTISNGGIYGSLLSTPIVNPPESGILGMHAIQERPVARNGQVVILPMMYVALTYDHRLVDGREAVSFLVRVKECIENPTRLLLEV